MVIGIYLLLVLIAFPVFIFIFAVAPKFGTKPRQDLYLFGGLTFTRTVASTVGTLFTTGFFFTAVVGYAALAGSWPLMGLFFAVPLIVFFIIWTVTSEEVRKYFRKLNQKPGEQPPEAFLGYLASNYGTYSKKAIWTVLRLNITLILFAELAYVLLLADKLLAPTLHPTWTVALVLVWVCYLYVYLGGYELVLRTDGIQLIAVLICLGIVITEVIAILHIDIWTLINSVVQTSLDTPPVKQMEASHIVNSAKGINYSNQAQFYSFVGAAIFSFLVFVASSDIWIRLVRAIYLTPIKTKAGTVSGIFGEISAVRRSGKVWLFFVLVTALVLFLFQLPGYLGVYSTNMLGEVDSEASIKAIQWLVYDSPQGVAEGRFFSNLHELALVITLMLMSMAVMTTLDTNLIALPQLKANYTYLYGDRHYLSTEESRRTVSWYFHGVLLIVFTLYLFLSRENFAYIVQRIGLFGGVFFFSTVFLIVSRTFTPTWMKGRGPSLILVYVFGILSSIILGAALDYFGPQIPYMVFIRGENTGWNIGKIFVLSVVLYVMIFILAAWLDKFGLWKKFDDFYINWRKSRQSG